MPSSKFFHFAATRCAISAKPTLGRWCRWPHAFWDLWATSSGSCPLLDMLPKFQAYASIDVAKVSAPTFDWIRIPCPRFLQSLERVISWRCDGWEKGNWSCPSSTLLMNHFCLSWWCTIFSTPSLSTPFGASISSVQVYDGLSSSAGNISPRSPTNTWLSKRSDVPRFWRCCDALKQSKKNLSVSFGNSLLNDKSYYILESIMSFRSLH